MMDVSRFSYCYGCGVCSAVCPKKAISMELNEDGFFHPVIDRNKCVDCGTCLKTCSFNFNEPSIEKQDYACYAAWSNDIDTRQKCSSGGVAYEIAKYYVRQGYRALLCRYNPSTKQAEHYLAESIEKLNESIGSKYIQSSTSEAFSMIEKGIRYVIVGSPCQIDSLRRIVKTKKMEDDVILVDFFCHGVPSYLMWKKYLSEIEKQTGPSANMVWRDKETGWHDSWVMKSGNNYASWFSRGDLFYRMFLKDRCLGKACYQNCKYKNDQSSADIRIGDLWGTKYADDDKGVNGVICFTEKGIETLKSMSDTLHIEPSTLSVVTESQMKRCAHRPISNNYVMKQLKGNKPLAQIDKMASSIELLEKIPARISYIIRRLPSKTKEIFHKV